MTFNDLYEKPLENIVRKGENALVTVAPIPPCRSMTSGENLTKVQLVRTNRLKNLSQQISLILRMNTILSSSCSQRPVT